MSKSVMRALLAAVVLLALAIIVAAIWSPYGQYPQGQLAWTGGLLLIAAYIAVPFVFW